MADVKLIINVDEKDVEFVKENFKPTGYSSIPLSIQTEFISAVLNGVPDSFMNKPCISNEVCEHDKNKAIDEIRSEIADLADYDAFNDVQQAFNNGLMRAVDVIDKYKSKIEHQRSEEQKNDCDNKARAILSELCEK